MVPVALMPSNVRDRFLQEATMRLARVRASPSTLLRVNVRVQGLEVRWSKPALPYIAGPVSLPEERLPGASFGHAQTPRGLAGCGSSAVAWAVRGSEN
jgi:hypothetical protein